MMKKVVFVGLALASISLSAAQGADLRPVYKAQPLPFVPQFSWTGFYVGVHLGAGWGTTEADDPNLNGCGPSNNTPKKCQEVGGVVVDGGGGGGGLAFSSSHTGNGILGGGQAGYNFQLGQWVYGLEVQGSLADIDGKGSCVGGAANCRSTVDGLITLAGRFGLALDRTLVYVKGGAAWAHMTFDVSNTGRLFKSDGSLVAGGEASDDRWGWMVGAGIEHAVMNNWSAKLEYNYMDFGNKTYLINDAPAFDVSQKVHLVKAGLNYRFAGVPWAGVWR